VTGVIGARPDMKTRDTVEGLQLVIDRTGLCLKLYGHVVPLLPGRSTTRLADLMLSNALRDPLFFGHWLIGYNVIHVRISLLGAFHPSTGELGFRY
jgi:hypothetical protein